MLIHRCRQKRVCSVASRDLDSQPQVCMLARLNLARGTIWLPVGPESVVRVFAEYLNILRVN